MSAEFDDPFRPLIPKVDEPGRLFAHGRLEAGWPCRWCGKLLAQTPAETGLVCLYCDDAQMTTQEPTR